MAALLTKNNAYSAIASWAIGTGTGTFTVTASTGSRFPAITGGDWFFVTLQDASNNIDIVKITALSADTLNIGARAQEGTTARTWVAGDIVELRLTAGITATTDGTQTLTNKTIALGSNTVSGTLAQFNTAVTDADLASLAGAETLTNKTIALGSNTVSGTLAQFNTAVTDADLASLAGTETLTNKTLTSPTITTPSITFTSSVAVTAGTNAQGQGALTSDFNVITTAAANPSGVTLPTATAGRRVTIVNRGANPVNVYPATGANIDTGAANAAVSLPVGGYIEFMGESATAWESSKGKVAPVVSGLATGILKNTTGTGALSIATSGTDYQAPIGTISGVVKGNGANALTAATAGTDYVAPGTATNFTATQRADYNTASVSTTSSYSFAGADQIVNITFTNAITVTFAAPSGLVTGAYYTFILTAGDTSARTYAWNAAWKFPAATPPLTSGPTTSGSVDVITFLALSATTAAYVGHTADCR